MPLSLDGAERILEKLDSACRQRSSRGGDSAVLLLSLLLSNLLKNPYSDPGAHGDVWFQQACWIVCLPQPALQGGWVGVLPVLFHRQLGYILSYCRIWGLQNECSQPCKHRQIKQTCKTRVVLLSRKIPILQNLQNLRCARIALLAFWAKGALSSLLTEYCPPVHVYRRLRHPSSNL